MTQYYEIRVKGHLDMSWSDWFDGMAIVHDGNGETLIAGTLLDQAALHGVLRKVSNLNLPLISVNPVDTEPQEDADKP
jgi:hypothetical protein